MDQRSVSEVRKRSPKAHNFSSCLRVRIEYRAYTQALAMRKGGPTWTSAVFLRCAGGRPCSRRLRSTR